MWAKKFVSMCICTMFLVSPLSVYAADSISLKDEVESFLEKKINIVDELLLLNVGKEISEDEFLEQVNQVHIDYEDYLITLEDAVLYEIESYDILNDKLGELDLKAESFFSEEDEEMQTTAKSWRYGDILYYAAGNKVGVGEKSYTGHTAVLHTVDYHVIEASKTVKNGAKVFVWNRSNLWKGASGIKQYRVTTKLGKSATAAQRKKAVEFGKKQEGEPYKLRTDIWSTDAWYCSKLTNAMWSHAGYDLRSSRAFKIDGLLAVIPADIVADANTRLKKKWGTALPGKI